MALKSNGENNFQNIVDKGNNNYNVNSKTASFSIGYKPTGNIFLGKPWYNWKESTRIHIKINWLHTRNWINSN